MSTLLRTEAILQLQTLTGPLSQSDNLFSSIMASAVVKSVVRIAFEYDWTLKKNDKIIECVLSQEADASRLVASGVDIDVVDQYLDQIGPDDEYQFASGPLVFLTQILLGHAYVSVSSDSADEGSVLCISDATDIISFIERSLASTRENIDLVLFSTALRAVFCIHHHQSVFDFRFVDA